MAVFRGRSGIFVLKLKNCINCKIKCKRQSAYKLYQNLDSFINTLIPNVNVIIKYHNKESMA